MEISRWKSSFCFIFFFLFYFFFNSVNAGSSGIKLQLIHRRDIHGTQSLIQALQNDAVRLRAISRREKPVAGGDDSRDRRIPYLPACSGDKHHFRNVSGRLPLYSAADYGVGQYFVTFRAGSPAQKMALIADTGSDLTWMKCGIRCPSGRCSGRRFRRDRSRSFTTVPCSSIRCKVDLANLFSLATCPVKTDPCRYDYRYWDGSSAVGVFAKERVVLRLSNGTKARLRGVLVGCTESYAGQSFQAADGVLGLGYSNFSFAITAANRFGGKFSYCLVDHLSPKKRSSYITFGPQQKSIPTISDPIHYTELILGVINPSYAVNVRSISIGGASLDIPRETWNVNGLGGMIIDSGSSLTALTQPAYRPVIAALKEALADFKNLHLSLGPLEYCFNSTGFNESSVPRLAFHFADGARFVPPVKSYVIDAAPEIKCLGFVAADWPGVSVIGNIMQQRYWWEFDVVKRRLGFAPSSCV